MVDGAGKECAAGLRPETEMGRQVQPETMLGSREGSGPRESWDNRTSLFQQQGLWASS